MIQAPGSFPGEVFWAFPSRRRPQGRPKAGLSAGYGTSWYPPGGASGSGQGENYLLRLLPPDTDKQQEKKNILQVGKVQKSIS